MDEVEDEVAERTGQRYQPDPLNPGIGGLVHRYRSTTRGALSSDSISAPVSSLGVRSAALGELAGVQVEGMVQELRSRGVAHKKTTADSSIAGAAVASKEICGLLGGEKRATMIRREPSCGAGGPSRLLTSLYYQALDSRTRDEVQTSSRTTHYGTSVTRRLSYYREMPGRREWLRIM